MEVLEERFTDWGLTPAERDVALFAIKGMSTQEIADAARDERRHGQGADQRDLPQGRRQRVTAAPEPLHRRPDDRQAARDVAQRHGLGACAIETAPSGTMSSARRCVAARLTFGATPSSAACRNRPAQRHQRSPGFRPGKRELRPRGRQVVADVLGEGEELRRHHRADGMAAAVLGAGVAGAVAEEAGHRLGRTGAEAVRPAR